MTDRELMQQALEALELVMSHGSAVQKAKDVLRAALAKPIQPVTLGSEKVRHANTANS